MKISKNISLKKIQNNFRDIYPGLKLEFYRNAHVHFEGSLKNNILNSDIILGEVNQNLIAGNISFEPNKTVQKLENEFKTNFGLNAQVHRRSNDLWLQTINTDDWTLEQQNQRGIDSVTEPSIIL